MFTVDASEFEREFADDLKKITREFKREAGEEVERVFKQDVMGTWYRKYATKISSPNEQTVMIEILNEGSKAVGSNPLDPRPARDNVPFYLDGGARRLVRMTEVFTAKTSPGSLKSVGGTGTVLVEREGNGFAIFGDEVKRIKPRQFTEQIYELADTKIAEEALNTALDQVWR